MKTILEQLSEIERLARNLQEQLREFQTPVYKPIFDNHEVFGLSGKEEYLAKKANINDIGKKSDYEPI